MAERRSPHAQAEFKRVSNQAQGLFWVLEHETYILGRDVLMGPVQGLGALGGRAALLGFLEGGQAAMIGEVLIVDGFDVHDV